LRSCSILHPPPTTTLFPYTTLFRSIAIPCHELYIRTILQNQLQQKLSQPIIAIVIAALASSSLFLYLGNIPIFVFILLAQLILSTLYFYTKRIITSYIAQVAAIIILVIIFS